jgi:hypothetical protein
MPTITLIEVAEIHQKHLQFLANCRHLGNNAHNNVYSTPPELVTNVQSSPLLINQALCHEVIGGSRGVGSPFVTLALRCMPQLLHNSERAGSLDRPYRQS